MARNEHDANAMLAGTYHSTPSTDEQTAALEALQQERETAERIMRERSARRFSFA
jgi:hypothetical protein